MRLAKRGGSSEKLDETYLRDGMLHVRPAIVSVLGVERNGGDERQGRKRELLLP